MCGLSRKRFQLGPLILGVESMPIYYQKLDLKLKFKLNKQIFRTNFLVLFQFTARRKKNVHYSKQVHLQKVLVLFCVTESHLL